jgi:hypothetical protein
MTATSFALQRIYRLTRLLKGREALQTKLDKVNRDLQRRENGKVSAAPRILPAAAQNR